MKGSGAYGASKHAVVAISESLGQELRQTGQDGKIGVHVLCPAIVNTKLFQTSMDLGADPNTEAGKMLKQVFESVIMGKFGMTPRAHAQQVFDLIERGDFYLFTDNIRPYVDHDHPFDIEGAVQHRMES